MATSNQSTPTTPAPVHSDARPFCANPDCDTCHEDAELVRKFIQEPMTAHRITGNQAMALYWGTATDEQAAAIIARIVQVPEQKPTRHVSSDDCIPTYPVEPNETTWYEC